MQGCVLQMLISFHCPCFSSLMGLSRTLTFHTFSGMLASGKQLAKKKKINNKLNKDIKNLNDSVIFFFVDLLFCIKF